MRWNLAVAYGLDAAERFLEYYRDISSETENDQHYWDVVTVLDVLAEIDPDDLPATWQFARFEQPRDGAPPHLTSISVPLQR